MFESVESFIFEKNTLVVYSKNEPRECFTDEVELTECTQFEIEDYLDIKTHAFATNVSAIRVSNASGKRKMVAVPESELNDWIKEKFAAIGCSIDEIKIGRIKWEKFMKNENTSIIISSYSIGGILTITDEELFKSNFFKGIGKHKTWGVGAIII
jgi:CRISPR-associated protein Cas6/Cse3/CasE subtype I-E